MSSRQSYLSIFEKVRKTKYPAYQFKWIAANRYITLDPSAFLIEGNLTEIKSNEETESRHYILTRDTLISARNHEIKTITLDDLTGYSTTNYILPLINPKLRKIRFEEGFGFKLSAEGIVHKFCCESKEQMQEWYNALKTVCIQDDFEMRYKMGEIIGTGSTATVRVAINQDTGVKYAIKCIEKEKLAEKSHSLVFFINHLCKKDYLINEIEILRLLKHPNIVALHEIYENDSYVYLVFELSKGGNLEQKVKSRKCGVNEKEAAEAMKVILETLMYCHENGIIHRDLKLSNIIVVYFLSPSNLI